MTIKIHITVRFDQKQYDIIVTSRRYTSDDLIVYALIMIDTNEEIIIVERVADVTLNFLFSLI